MNHDELFKELLQNFFREFLQLFFPNEAAQLDFATVQFLNQEAFTDFPEGNIRRADVIAEVSTATGETEIILIHIEIQAKRENDIPFRMWEYYHLFRLRHRRPVFPVVLYLTPGSGGITVERYNEEVLGRRFLQFEYAVVGLPDLVAKDYESLDAPLAVALSALMRSSDRNRVERKLRALRRAALSDLDEARKLLLATIVDRYLPLNASEQTEFTERLARDQGQETSATMSIYTLLREEGRQEGIEQGVEQGVEQGILRGQRTMLLESLQAKFGPLPNNTIRRIESIASSKELTDLQIRAMTATDLSELDLV